MQEGLSDTDYERLEPGVRVRRALRSLIPRYQYCDQVFSDTMDLGSLGALPGCSLHPCSCESPDSTRSSSSPLLQTPSSPSSSAPLSSSYSSAPLPSLSSSLAAALTARETDFHSVDASSFPPQCECCATTPLYRENGLLRPALLHAICSEQCTPPLFECHSACACSPLTCSHRVTSSRSAEPATASLIAPCALQVGPGEHWSAPGTVVCGIRGLQVSVCLSLENLCVLFPDVVCSPLHPSLLRSLPFDALALTLS
jgi:hypothetical protein